MGIMSDDAKLWVKRLTFVTAAVLTFIGCIFCMCAHGDHVISFKGSSDLELGLWRLKVGSKRYTLDFAVDSEMAKIPSALRSGLKLGAGSFHRRFNTARVFLMFSHYSAVVCFFFAIMYALDILTETKGALGVIGANFTHLCLLLITVTCMTTGYNELESVGSLGWSGGFIWFGFAQAIFCLLLCLVGIAADKTISSNSFSPSHDHENTIAESGIL